jgi:flavin reductase (DIM6/NTAB) family NADH-FMN oxidoreductase RutF
MSVSGAERSEVAPTHDPVAFRRLLSHFATGVVVVTAADPEPVGLTCQSFSSLSLDPPLVMFSPARTSTSWPRIRAVGRFAVNILAEDQEELCRRFAVSGGDKFAGVDWHPGTTGAPILAGTLAHVECVLHAVHPGGDHDIVVGSPVSLQETSTAQPLLFFRGA